MVSPRKKYLKIIGTLLVSIAGLLLVMHVLSVLMPINLQIFDLDNERNIPTAYTSLLLAASAIASLILMRRAKTLSERATWVLLAVLYCYLAFDESLILHERLAEPVRSLLSITAGNPFYHAWVIPGIAITCTLGLLALALKMLTRMERHQLKVIGITISLAATVILLEVIGTQLYFSNIVYKLGPVLVEEMTEISLVSLILFTLVEGVLIVNRKNRSARVKV